MGSKNDPGKFDCYANALPDEPMFILLGRDPCGPELVDEWADQREADIDDGIRPEADRPMVIEARQCAERRCYTCHTNPPHLECADSDGGSL